MGTPLWTVELHSHTIYSRDCMIRLEDLQKICRKRGIDKLAITDHNTAKAALEMARLYPMLIIPGEEIMTSKGEILAWFIKEEVPAGLSPFETIERLRGQGAIISAAHPFDRYRKGGWRQEDLLAISEQLDAIEVFNSRCIRPEDNAAALAFATAHEKLMTCGSDAHIATEFGKAILKIRPFSNTGESFRQSLQSAVRIEVLSSPLVHLGSTYAKWIKSLLPFLQPL